MSAPRVCALCGDLVPGFHSYVRGWRCDSCRGMCGREFVAAEYCSRPRRHDGPCGHRERAGSACEWCGQDLDEMGSPNCRELCIECTGEDAGPCIDCGAIGSGPCSECGAGSTIADGTTDA